MGNGDRTPIAMGTPNPYEYGGLSVIGSIRSPGPGGQTPMFTPKR